MRTKTYKMITLEGAVKIFCAALHSIAKRWSTTGLLGECIHRTRSKSFCRDVTVSFCPAILPWCSHVNYVTGMLFAFVNSLNRVPTNSFSQSAMIIVGGPKYWMHRSAMHFATVSAVLSENRNAQLVQSALNTPCCRKRFWSYPETQISKRSTSGVSLKR